MGRGARATVRWKNDRIRKKKARDKRKAEAAHATRTGGSAGTTSASTPSS